MKLKKIVSLALAGILAVSMLTACGEGATDPTPNEPTEPTVTNYAQLLKDKLEYNPSKKVNAVSNSKLDDAMDVAMEFAADGSIAGAYLTNKLNETLYIGWDLTEAKDKENFGGVFNAANYLIRELNAENNIGQGISTACQVMQPTKNNYNKDNLNATLLFAVDGGKGINAVMEEVADLLDPAINALDDDFNIKADNNNGQHVQADYEYDMSVSVQTKTLTADHGKSLTLVAVNIARV